MSAMSPKPETDLTLASLIATDNTLKIVCVMCSRTKEMEPLEAVASYGGLLTFAEVRAVIWGRCKHTKCEARVGPGLRPHFRAGGK
jgi:hypothetical protein